MEIRNLINSIYKLIKSFIKYIGSDSISRCKKCGHLGILSEVDNRYMIFCINCNFCTLVQETENQAWEQWEQINI